MTAFVLIVSFVLGASFGSFFAATFLRLKDGKGLGGRSSCPLCGQQIRARDNIPILSWIALGGKSSCCSQPISSFYIKVEASTAIIFCLIALIFI